MALRHGFLDSTYLKDNMVAVSDITITRQNGLQNNWLLGAYIAEIVIKTDKVFRALPHKRPPQNV